MVAYTFYERDIRVRRYAEALVKRGDDVDAIVLSGVNYFSRSTTIILPYDDNYELGLTALTALHWC